MYVVTGKKQLHGHCPRCLLQRIAIKAVDERCHLQYLIQVVKFKVVLCVCWFFFGWLLEERCSALGHWATKSFSIEATRSSGGNALG